MRFKCKKCGSTFTRDTKAELCLECRIVYKNQPNPYIPVTVDNEKWLVRVKLHIFSKPKKLNDAWGIGNTFPSMNLENLAKCLTHLRPSISKDSLLRLFESAIKRGVYDSIDSFDSHKVFISLTVDSWLKLKPKTPTSKWTVTSGRQVTSIIRGQGKGG